MKRVWIVFLLVAGWLMLGGALCEPAEGVNVHNGVDYYVGDKRGTDGAGEDALEEDIPEPGPPFDDTLGWKALDPGQSQMWNDISGVAVEGKASRVFVVGGFGAVVSYEPAKRKWRSLNISDTRDVRGVWAAAPNYVTVCGEGGLLKRHFDYSGSGVEEWYNDDLSVGLSLDLEAVDGLAKDVMWAVGRGGTVLQFDGTSWKRWKHADIGFSEPIPSLYDVEVVTPDKVLMVGDGVLVKYEGGAFTIDATTFAGYDTRGIHEAAGKVWVGADKGTVFLDRGEGVWEKHQPNVFSVFEALWTAPSGKVFAAGSHPPPIVWVYDGNETDTWEYLPVESPKFIKDQFPDRIVTNSRISGIWGTGEQNIFVCTKEKQIIHYAVHK